MALSSGSRSLNATVNIEVDGVEKPVMTIYATVTPATLEVNINTKVVDKSLVTAANAKEIKIQYDEFLDEVKAVANQHGVVYL